MMTDKNKPVRIRLINESLRGFSGVFGMYEFEDGVSEPLIRREAERLSVITHVEFLDDAEDMWERKARERGVISSDVMTNVEDAAPKKATKKSKEQSVTEPVADTIGRKLYTREELESIADKDGIAGLRKIGNELSVASHSIVGLMEEIMNAQERL